VQAPVVASSPQAPAAPVEIPLLSAQPARSGLEAAWLDLEVISGSYCVVVRMDGAICVE
jgi:hypothetical protein